MAIVKRFSITLPDQVDALLAEWAKQRGQPKADLASFLVERGIEDARDKGYLRSSLSGDTQRQDDNVH